MAVNYRTLTWQESKNGVTINCDLDIAVHPSNSNIILLTVPGVDGSVDGYKNKYVQIAEEVQSTHGAAIVRMSNPFVTSFHWESNLRHALKFIDENLPEITGAADIEIRILAHSAGAAVAAQIAWEYPKVTRLLLINPATKLGIDDIKRGIGKFNGDMTILFGSKDPSHDNLEHLTSAAKPEQVQAVVLEDVDHNFSGEALELFIQSPSRYLFN